MTVITEDNTKEFWGIASNGKNLCILAKQHKAFTAEAARYITASKYQAGEHYYCFLQYFLYINATVSM